MTKRDTSRACARARTQGQPGAATATGLSEVFDALDAFLARVGAQARKRDHQRRAARALANMSDHALRDIDLHRSEIISATHNLGRFRRFEGRRRPRA
jgi:uncharacterized protein YjiS (DUF1127 family)